MRFVLLCWLCAGVLGVSDFPRVRFWAFRPRGLEICIDDQPKLTQFYIDGDIYKNDQKTGTVIGGVLTKRDSRTWCWKHETLVLSLGDSIRYVARGVIGDVEKKVEATKIITVYDLVNDYYGTSATTTNLPLVTSSTAATTTEIMTIKEFGTPESPIQIPSQIYFDPQPFEIKPVEKPVLKKVVIVEESIVCNKTILDYVKEMEDQLKEMKNLRDAQDEQIEKLKRSLDKKTRENEILMEMYFNKTKTNDNYLVMKTMYGVFPLEDASIFLHDFLKEKLFLCKDEFSVKSAEKVNETIRFEVGNYKEKLNILITAHRVLEDSRFVIVDSDDDDRNNSQPTSNSRFTYRYSRVPYNLTSTTTKYNKASRPKISMFNRGKTR